MSSTNVDELGERELVHEQASEAFYGRLSFFFCAFATRSSCFFDWLPVWSDPASWFNNSVVGVSDKLPRWFFRILFEHYRNLFDKSKIFLVVSFVKSVFLGNYCYIWIHPMLIKIFTPGHLDNQHGCSIFNFSCEMYLLVFDKSKMITSCPLF